ncbi:Leucine-rich repeat flightless-interacting protein 2 [Schistosoma japonicum]|nr:Leucine-rich repeat flightless-interacting protein 2 [Schistosoma japonicum]
MASRHVPYTDMSDMGRAAQETEIQRAANQQLIEEGRIIKHKELEKMRREEECKDDSSSERPDVIIRVNSGGTSRLSSQRSSADLASSVSSRNLDARELKSQLIQLEEKVKGAMLSNVQLDNEKQLLKYEVDLLKDKLEDLTDAYASLNKTFLENKRDLAYQKMQIVELTHRLNYARHQVEARDQLIVEHGLVLIGGDANTDNNLDDVTVTAATNVHLNKEKSINNSNAGDLVMMNGLSCNNHSKSNSLVQQNGDKPIHLPEMALITKSTAELLNTLSETTLDKQIRQLFSIRSELDARVEELESQLREERKRSEAPTTRYDSRNRTNTAHTEDIKHELQQIRNQAQEYKLKYHESSQKISALESDIVRLEGQTKRYKAIADACEEQEEILKQDRRKCQRELRDVQSKLEDLKAENARLQRVVDKYNRGSVAPGSLAPAAGNSIRQARDSSVNR